MTDNLLPILLVIFLAGVGVFGDFFIKLAGSGERYITWPYFIIGLLTYALSAIGWFYVMKHIELNILGIFYSLTTVILLFIVGTVFFKEHVNAYEIIGIILGIISIAMLSRFA